MFKWYTKPKPINTTIQTATTSTNTTPQQQITATQMKIQQMMLTSQLQSQMYTQPWKPPFPVKDVSMDYPQMLAILPSGSRVICDPPVLDTDEDFFILVDKYPSDIRMETDGWEKCDKKDGYMNGPIKAFRKGTKNWIFTTSRDHYVRVAAATALAKELNLTRKEDRIALFSMIQGEYVNYDGPLPNKGFF